jgi:hypothetical protein
LADGEIIHSVERKVRMRKKRKINLNLVMVKYLKYTPHCTQFLEVESDGMKRLLEITFSEKFYP